jgi:hypothetical protein
VRWNWAIGQENGMNCPYRYCREEIIEDKTKLSNRKIVIRTF